MRPNVILMGILDLKSRKDRDGFGGDNSEFEIWGVTHFPVMTRFRICHWDWVAALKGVEEIVCVDELGKEGRGWQANAENNWNGETESGVSS